uniref:GtrA family protein n=1 Tax=Agathobacter sp. TaxID=2021311 RepID=UPI0040575355
MNFYKKNKPVVLYFVFGAAATVVNIVSYYVCYEMLHVSNPASTIIAWLLSVVFAYITNRNYVFQSKSSGIRAWVQEIVSFFGCRIATGVMDMVIMVVAVDYLQQDSMFWKTASNALVVIVNYAASKYLIFIKK